MDKYVIVRPTDASHNRSRRRIPVIDYSVLADRIFDSGNYRCNPYSGMHVVLRGFESAHAACSPQQYNVESTRSDEKENNILRARAIFGDGRIAKKTKYCLDVNNGPRIYGRAWGLLFFK